MSTTRNCLTAALKVTTRRLHNHLSSTVAATVATSTSSSTVVVATSSDKFRPAGPLHVTRAAGSNSGNVTNVAGVGCRSLMTLSASTSSSLNYTLHGNDVAVGYDVYQKRCLFDKRKKKKKKRKKINDPFRVLGVKENMPYKDVKKKFLLIAMENHPDTAAHKAATEEELDTMREKFITARTAFESLVECAREGVALHKSDVEDEMDNFDSWFKSETGFDTPFQFDMDPETMKEVAKMTEDMSVGLDRDGGMWTLAKMVTSAVKSGGEAGTLLRLDAGDVKDGGASSSSSTGPLRRRRRR